MSAFRWSLALATVFAAPLAAQSAQPWWLGTSTCYEVFVRSFYDSDGDGIGDFRGLTERLDYINDGNPNSTRDLGASCIWLMPVNPSPSYHGYDVTNYYDINREYGTLDDFRRFLAEAHRRGIRVLMDMVLNHMSSEHPYFKSALLDAASPYRSWWNWSPTQRRTANWQAQTWHKVPMREEWYYGIFWGGMPDLNLASPAVRAEAERIARFWLADVGVDGFRLDAVGHFFEDGDEPRNHPQGQAWLREYAAALERIRPGTFTVGEVWENLATLRGYYPDQLTAYFAFELADSLIHAVRGSSARALIAAVERMQTEFPAGRYGSFQRNHDQTRTMTEYRGDWARARLSATLLLTLPGLPFVYYGEELGMTGDKRHGDPRLRTPMPWARQPAAGFTRGLPWEPLPADSFTANVEPMESDSTSLLNHYRRMIHLRAARPALGAAATFTALTTGSDSVLAYVRRGSGNPVLVVANMSGTRRPAPALAAAAGVLPAGNYAVRAVVGRAPEGTLRVAANARVAGWSPVAALEPFEAVVFDLVPR